VVVDTTRDMVFIEDLVRAVLHVRSWQITGTFDICSGVHTPIMELFQLVANEIGSPEVPPMIPPDPDDVQGEVSRKNGMSGWRAEVTLRDGIRKTVDSYRESGVGQTHTHLRIGEKDAS
jgi:nucleoside-diphosphate-sugar epimerase